MRKLLIAVSLVAVLLALSVGSALTQQQRTGAWVDETVFTEVVDRAQAVDMLIANQLDLYAFGISEPNIFAKIKASPELGYETSYGSYNELTFNPVGPTFPGTGAFNPFHFPRIREAMNWLIDRNYIVSEIMGGLGVPRWFAITPAFPDYARYADVARALELQYGYDKEKAKAVITEEMEKAGAVLQDGKWYYGGQPVTIIFLIRVEDERRQIGDYIATLLEDIGFTVDRQYKTAREASACWIRSDPATGCFHIYTGGWVTTIIDRDQGSNFDFFYTPRGLPYPLWAAYTPDPEFDEVADRLARNDYKTMEERRELFAKALELSMKDSVRVWLTNRVSITPRRANVAVGADLAGGVYGSWSWGFTIRFTDRPAGGTMRIAMPSILPEPWNPLGGTNWVYDMMIMRGMSETLCEPSPFTGLYLPQRIEKAEVYVKEGLPVFKTLDWVDLKFEPEIKVPADAWIDWDAKAQKFITVGQKYPEGLTANAKVVVHYAPELYQIKWHDGVNESLADIVLPLILTFDRANPDSAIYDEVVVPDFEQFVQYYKGFRIVQKDPLITEYYTDLTYLDAETLGYAGVLEPYYSYGPGSMHALALGILAEANQELTFTSDKADKLGKEWMSYIAGPSLPILEKYLDQAIAEKYIPYANTLGQFITPDEAVAQYQALKAWYQAKGHFFVSQGPSYLEEVRPVEKIVVLKQNTAYIDPSEGRRIKWLEFGKPKIADVAVTGPTEVKIGGVADFLIDVTFEDQPYPLAEIDFAKYLVIDATGKLALVGPAEAVSDGLLVVSLSSEDTKKLVPGPNRLEVVVVSKVVSIPGFGSLGFVTTP
ncbi:MAG: ABC transporter substrate-binding protein [Candidatus Bipolaricaulia bacterium]